MTARRGRQRLRDVVVVAVACCKSLSIATAADAVAPAPLLVAATPEPPTTQDWQFDYEYPGLDIASPGGDFTAHIELRMQLRYSHVMLDDAPPGEPATDIDHELNRGRFKMGGELFDGAIDYYTEYDFPSERLLDLRTTLAANDALQLRLGQWKVPYNRERVDSSGQQQFVDRSIVNEFFTLDRQRGMLLFGRLWAETAADSWYNVAMLEGTGRDGSGHASEPMLLGRWQWNFHGRDLGFSQSDVGYRAKPAGSLAIAAARVRGPYTRYSSAGGGQLIGFEDGTSDRYRIEQAMFESAWQYRGFSWQQEFHWKSIDDTEAGRTVDLKGGYAQAGYFPHAALPAIPKPLELAARFARVDPDRDTPNDRLTETIIAANWYFAGHDNKLTVDYSWLHDERVVTASRSRRWRAQWDVSF